MSKNASRADNLQEEDYDAIVKRVEENALLEIEDEDVKKCMTEQLALLHEENAQEMEDIPVDLFEFLKEFKKSIETSEKTEIPTKFGFSKILKPTIEDEELLTIEQIAAFVRKNHVGYEVFRNAVVPFYDVETYYKSSKERMAAWTSFIQDNYKKVRDYYGEKATIYAFDASGKTSNGVFEKGTAAVPRWKNSAHFIVRGVGFYSCGKQVPRIDSKVFDQSVYEDVGKRQLFKLPFCESTDGQKRVFKPIDNIDTDPEVIAITKEMYAAENYGKFIVSNIAGEEKAEMDDAVDFWAAYTKSDGVKTHTNQTEMTEEAFIALVECNALNCKQELSWDEWIEIMWIIVNEGTRLGFDYRKIAFDFSRLSSKFIAAETENVLRRARTSDSLGKVKGIGTLCMRAKERNNEAFALWIKKYRTKHVINAKDPYVWGDFQSYYSKRVFNSLEEVTKTFYNDINRVLAIVLTGKGMYIKKDDVIYIIK